MIMHQSLYDKSSFFTHHAVKAEPKNMTPTIMPIPPMFQIQAILD